MNLQLLFYLQHLEHDMISFSTPAFDLAGSVILIRTERSDIQNTSRRVSRSATLDGSVSISDLGFTDGDRTFRIKATRISAEIYEAMAYIQQNYPLVMISTERGIFLGAIENLSVSRGVLRATYLVKEKLGG